jgi:hypothetical protein
MTFSQLTKRQIVKRVAGLFLLTLLWVLFLSFVERRSVTPIFLIFIITALGILFVVSGVLAWKFREKVAQGSSLQTPVHKLLYWGIALGIFGILHFFFPPVPIKAYILLGIGGVLFTLGALGISRTS